MILIFSFINHNARELNLTLIAKNIKAFGALAPLLVVFQEWLCWLKKGIFGHFCEKVVNYLDIFWTYISFQSINSELNQLHKLSPRNKSRHGWLDPSDGSAILRSRGADRRGQMSWDIWKSQHFLVWSLRDDSSLNWDRGLVVWLRICGVWLVIKYNLVWFACSSSEM